MFSKRLKNARIMAELSQDHLVKIMGNIVSKNAISKYEKGQMLPNSKVLLELSKALDVKPDYFFRPMTIEINRMEYRKRSKIGAKKLYAIEKKTADFIERYLELEEFLNIDLKFINPIKNNFIECPVDIENAANTLLKKWNVGFNALPSVLDLLEEHHIKIIGIDAENKFDGLSGYANGKYPFIAINRHYTVERKRLTVLHELGHLLLNFSDKFTDKDIEKLCYRFAGSILIPEETLKMELGKKRHKIIIPELITLKEKYGISIQAIMYRAMDLKIISKYYFKMFFVYISKNKEEEGLGNYICKEEPTRFKQLIYRAVSEEMISMSKAADLSNQKIAKLRKEFAIL